MGLENHRCRDGRLINVLAIFVATRYNPTYKNKPDDASHCRVFVFGYPLSIFTKKAYKTRRL